MNRIITLVLLAILLTGLTVSAQRSEDYTEIAEDGA